jgi:hypothetical protein
MKALILITFMAFFGLGQSYASDESVCTSILADHVELIKTTDTYFRQIEDHAGRISSYEITQLQKKLTKRFLSLKNLFNIYDDEVLNCPTKILPTALAIYDFSKIGETIFSSKVLRRVVLGFVKHPAYKLTDFKAYYDRYTNKKLIYYIQEKIEKSEDIDQAAKEQFETTNGSPSTVAVSDYGVKVTTSVVAGVARAWGFISDHLSWRQGRLKDNEEAKALLVSNLKPLDLVFEKRTFVLSNYTIPGHWGHVAIWLGTKEELIALGIWDQDYFAPFRAQVEAGNSILEIRKKGINYQSLDSFINLDEIAVTRVKNILDNAEYVFSNLAEQLNKEYDFKFDARTADKLTCTELIAFSYGDILWHQTKTLFQISLRPDDMALISLGDNAQSEFVLYLKGNKDRTTFRELALQDWSKLYSKK